MEKEQEQEYEREEHLLQTPLARSAADERSFFIFSKIVSNFLTICREYTARMTE